MKRFNEVLNIVIMNVKLMKLKNQLLQMVYVQMLMILASQYTQMLPIHIIFLHRLNSSRYKTKFQEQVQYGILHHNGLCLTEIMNMKNIRCIVVVEDVIKNGYSKNDLPILCKKISRSGNYAIYGIFIVVKIYSIML